MKIDDDFRARVVRHDHEARESDHSVHLNRVITTAVDGFHGTARARRFEFSSDEPAEGGGTNEGPRPLEYFLAGFAFCQQVQYAKQAVLRGIDLTGLKMDVRGYVDQRGVLGAEGVPAGFQRVDYQVKIESSADANEIEALVTLVESVCPAHAALKGSTQLNRSLILNGEVVGG